MKPRLYAAVAAATMLMGVNVPAGAAAALATVSGDSSNSAYTTTPVRAMTWNICGEAGGATPASSAWCPDRDSVAQDRTGGTALKVSTIAEVADQQNLNTVMLQEICSTGPTDDPVSTDSEADQIKAALGAGWNYAMVTSVRPDGTSECRDGLSGTLSDVILVKGVIDSTYDGPTIASPPAGTGVNEQAMTPVLCIGVTGWQQHICTVHVGNFGGTAADTTAYDQQISALTTAVGYYPDVVVGGDFNTVQEPALASLYALMPECDQNQSVAPGDTYPGRATQFALTGATVDPTDQSVSGGSYVGTKIDYLFSTTGFSGCDVEQQHADQTNYSLGVQPNCYLTSSHPDPVCTPDTGEISDHAPLIGYTKGSADLDWRLNDGSGATAADSSGSGLNGSLSSGVGWSTAHGGVATFNGSNGEITAPSTVVDTSNSFTVSAWADVTPGAGNSTVLSEDGTDLSGFILWYDAADGTWRFTMSTEDADAWNVDQAISSSPAATGVWTQLTAVYDHQAGEMTLYVDGVAVGSHTHSATVAVSGSLVAGRDLADGTPGTFFNGSLQDIEAFDYSFSAGEVQSLATGLTEPTATVTSPATGTGDPGCDSYGDYGTVHTLTPTLTAAVLDADPSKAVHADFAIWDDTVAGNPQPIAMGGAGSASDSVTGAGTVSVTVPTLIAGHLYGWYARTDDNTQTSATSTVCHFYAAAN